MKYHFFLTLLFLILIPGGWILTSHTNIRFEFSEFAITVTYLFLVSQTVLYLFFKGLEKSPGKGVIYTFVSLSAKFIMYLVFLVVFWLVAKNLTADYLITFFVLYLAFTFFVLIVMVKTLKNKQL